ncbi:TonB-dependent receptor [Pseudoflavitalea sp. G-6-1-2]|uniref:TonB-dependent receptor n=1 Tax=Pseudoflavitalea sp. G-6-1-2 TaxID=2728841 RepID=UPI00146D57A6|nr:TonB-dependent receptor [Pseudoflavitalea sp. G-6-1-2]NML22901.1 TonB-dependent receptor [Pseudoflavitalea sp. G-6-1-2]
MLTAILALITFVSFAQEKSGSIRGTVITSDSTPAANVSVIIQSTKQGTATDNDGNFEFARLKAGQYVLQVSLLGYEEIEQIVTVVSGQTASPLFTLKISNNQLQTVIITAGKNKFLVKKSQTVAKMPLSNLENPQAYSSISKELIKEQVTTDFSNLLKNAPGVYKISGTRGINLDGATAYSLRGFRTEVSMIDGMPSQTNGEIDPANVEKVEVLRGPSGTLFGGAVTSFGGVINIITRKPQEKFGGEVSYATGSFNLNRATADVYGSLNKKGSVLGRINASFQRQGSFQDVGFRQTFFIAPALEIRMNPKLKINLNAEIYNSEFTNASSIFLNRVRQLVARTPDELKFDWHRSYTTKDITMKTPTTNLRAQVQYQLAKNWTSTTIISRNERRSNGFYQYEFIRLTNDYMLERNISLQKTRNATFNAQQNFVGDFKIGKLRNRLVFGLDYVNFGLKNNNSPYIAFDTINAQQYDEAKYRSLTRDAVMAKITAAQNNPKISRVWNSSQSNVYSAYLSDVLNITDNLMAMVSLRLDRFESNGTYDGATDTLQKNTKFGQTALSPKFGLVYQLIKDRVSVFANYMNGFANVTPKVQPRSDISPMMKPQHANQYEAGVKLDLLNGRLNLTASYYDIKLNNAVRTDVVVINGESVPGVTVQNGMQYSRGFELEVIANPVSGLNLVAGYTHNNSEFTKTSAETDGRRPPGAGPSDLANAWISYGIPKGKLKGLGAGFGGNYVSKFNTVNTVKTGLFTFPSYTLLNATVFYETKRFRVGLKVDNLNDVDYFLGQGVIAAQMPRSYIANFTVKL